jgi:divalent metal cation (Fe/Co/Zn/Cd) transporter
VRQRDRHVSEAIWWCSLSIAWAVIVGVSGLASGLASGAIALVGFGADSLVDGIASAVLVWRFRRERSDREAGQLAEDLAGRAVGAVLIVIGLYVGVSAVAALLDHSAPDKSSIGAILTAASVLVLPVLARAKLRIAAALKSAALRGDGVLSFAGAALAAVTLISLALDTAFGWWWSDAVAAVLIAGFLLHAGWQTTSASSRRPSAAKRISRHEA